MNPRSLGTADLHPLSPFYFASFYSLAFRTLHFNNTKPEHLGAMDFCDYLQSFKLRRYTFEIPFFNFEIV